MQRVKTLLANNAHDEAFTAVVQRMMREYSVTLYTDDGGPYQDASETHLWDQDHFAVYKLEIAGGVYRLAETGESPYNAWLIAPTQLPDGFATVTAGKPGWEDKVQN